MLDLILSVILISLQLTQTNQVMTSTNKIKTKLIWDLLRSKSTKNDFKDSALDLLTSSKKSAISNLSSIQKFYKFVFILFQMHDKDIVLTTAHTEVKDGDCSYNDNSPEFNYLVVFSKKKKFSKLSLTSILFSSIQLQKSINCQN